MKGSEKVCFSAEKPTIYGKSQGDLPEMAILTRPVVPEVKLGLYK